MALFIKVASLLFVMCMIERYAGVSITTTGKVGALVIVVAYHLDGLVRSRLKPPTS